MSTSTNPFVAVFQRVKDYVDAQVGALDSDVSTRVDGLAGVVSRATLNAEAAATANAATHEVTSTRIGELETSTDEADQLLANRVNGLEQNEDFAQRMTYVQEDAPTTFAVGQLWFKPSTGELRVYTVDA